MEILIVVALISLIASSVPLTMNFRAQIDKSNDLKRKKELSILQSGLDEFYNDSNSYPTAANICMENSFSISIDGIESCGCYICGKKMTSLSAEQQRMLSYMKEIPCDPNSGESSSPQQYFYNYDCRTTNPQWYRIYTILSNPKDPGVAEVGCGAGCGWNEKYNYGVGSPNIKIN